MDDNNQVNNTQTPPAATPTPTPTSTQAAPAQAAPATPAAPTNSMPAKACKCPQINPAQWDGQQVQLNKTFYKTFSPRIFHYPFSFAVDLNRAKTQAQAKGYTVVENPMVLDTMGMFLSEIMVEVTGADTNDKNIVSLAGKEVHSKLSRRPWKETKLDIADLEKELGGKPKELYGWWTSCPKCVKESDVKVVLFAVK